MQIRRQMTGIYHPCSTFTSQSAHFCDIFSKCKFVQIHFIVQCRISYNLGPGSAVGEKGRKRGQIGKISASERSQVVSWGGGKGGGAWRQSLMPPFHDTRFRYHALIGQMSSCWQIRGAVDSIVYFQYNAHTIRKRFFKTRISRTQHKFLCETFRLSFGSKTSKKYACDKRKRSIQNMELFLHSPVTKYDHIYKTIDL